MGASAHAAAALARRPPELEAAARRREVGVDLVLEPFQLVLDQLFAVAGVLLLARTRDRGATVPATFDPRVEKREVHELNDARKPAEKNRSQTTAASPSNAFASAKKSGPGCTRYSLPS